MAVPVPSGQDPLSPLYEGLSHGAAKAADEFTSGRGAPPFMPGWMGAPPMITQIGESLMKAPVFEEFFDGMRDELRRGAEQMGLLQEHMGQNWDTMIEAQREALAQTKAVTEEIVALKDAPVERLEAVRNLNEMNLPEVIKERAISFLEALGVFGQEVQRQAVDLEVARRTEKDEADEEQASQRVKEILGRVLKVMGVTEEAVDRGVIRPGASEPETSEPTRAKSPTEEASEQPSPATEATRQEQVARERAKRPQHPYGDVIDTREVTRADFPDPEGRPEGVPPGTGPVEPPRPTRPDLHPYAVTDYVAPDPEFPDTPRGQLQRRIWEEQQAEKAREAKPQRALPDSYAEGVRLGSDPSQWRETLTGAVSDRLNTWATGWADINRPEGATDLAGNWQWADPIAGAAYEASMSRIGRVQGVVDAYGKGGGLSGAISTALPIAGKALGVAGVAIGAGQLATSTLESQRAANMPYTSTYGDGQMDAYGQRAQEWAFSNLQMAGTMGSERASQLYQGVAQQALEGEDREDALEFAVANYRRFGMDIQQSMAFIEIATENGIESLDAYRVGLEAVAETAKESGQSIKEAQESYLNTVRELQGFTSGSATGQLATTLTGIQEERGNTPLGEADYSRFIQDESAITQYAALTGQDYSEVQAGIVAGDQAVVGAVIGNAEQRFVEMATQGRQPSAETRREIERINEATKGNPSVDDVNRIVGMLMQDGVAEDRMLESVSMAIFRERRPKTFLWNLIARSFMGDRLMDVPALAADIEERAMDAEVDINGLRRYFKDDPRMLNARSERRQEWGLSLTDEQRKDTWHKGILQTRWGNNVIDDADPIYKATDEYFRQIKDGRIDGSANMEDVFRYIGDLASEDTDAAREWASKKFVTTDAEGKETTFGFQDLPKYIEQMEAGKVSEVRGDGTRVALQDIVGFTPQATREAALSQTVKVEIEAKGPLADVLTVRQVGGTDIEANRERGTSPNPFPSRLPDWLGGG